MTDPSATGVEVEEGVGVTLEEGRGVGAFVTVGDGIGVLVVAGADAFPATGEVTLVINPTVVAGEIGGVGVGTAALVALSDERAAEVAVSERGVEETGSVVGGTVRMGAGGVTRVDIGVGDRGLVLMFRRKKRINKRIATINLKRS